MEFRRWRLILVALAVLLIAASCGGQEDEPEADSGAQEEQEGPVTLTFWQTMNEEETATLQGIVDAFEAENPNYTIEMEAVPFDQAQQRYDTAAQGGEAPDILRAEIAWTPQFAAQGYLADITDLVSEEDRADYLEAPFNYNVYQETVFGIPQVTDAPALLYNVEMFEKAGVSPPTSLDELVSACETFGSGKGIFLRGDSYFVQPWIWGYGGGLLDPSSQQILIDDPGSVAGLEAYTNLFNNECAFPNEDFANDYENMQTAFGEGEVAMIVNGPWATADLLARPAFKDPANLGVAPIPPGPEGQGSPVGGHNYVISESTENLEAAYEFISWLNSAENQATLAAENNLVPTRNSAYELPEVQDNRIISDFKAQMEVATNRPVIPEGGQIYTDFTPNVQQALTGDASAEEALSAVAEAWKAFLTGYE
jgi:arabinogalactan oligomer / maltooligosaccharide transport system substrate-binding protein